MCEKHWPKDFPRQKCQCPLGYIPIYPPSEFGTTPACCLPQTPSVVKRNIGNRNVSAESRAKRAKLDNDQCNLIKCWDDLKTYCQGLSLVYDLRTELINLYCIEEKPPSIIYSISISNEMKICAFKGNSEVSICDVVPSFDWKLRRYSELDDIIKKVRTFPMNMQTEIKHAADTLRSQCDDSDDSGGAHKKENTFSLRSIGILLHRERCQTTL